MRALAYAAAVALIGLYLNAVYVLYPAQWASS